MGGSEVPRSALPSLVQTTKPPVSAMAKLTPVRPASAARNFSRRWCRAASVSALGSERPAGAELFVEQLADLLLFQVNGGHDDVARALLAKLHDALAQISVDDFDAARLEIRIEVALLGEHRLALDQPLDAALLQQPVHDAVVLAGVARPVHLRPQPDGVALELLEIVAEPRERMGLDLRRQPAQLFPFRDDGRSDVALLAHEPHRGVVPLEPRLVADEELRALRMRQFAHGRASRPRVASASTSAMCCVRSGPPARLINPCSCIRQDWSPATITSAPACA
jgi:hypothetical protein